MRSERTDTAIAKHVDAIRALIKPDVVLALFCLDAQGAAYFVAPASHDILIRAALQGYTVLADNQPGSP